MQRDYGAEFDAIDQQDQPPSNNLTLAPESTQIPDFARVLQQFQKPADPDTQRAMILPLRGKGHDPQPREPRIR